MFRARSGLTATRVLPALLAGLLLAGTGCSPAVLSVNVTVVTQTCGTEQPLGNGAAVLRFTVFGSGIDSQQSQTSVQVAAAGAATIPAIPVGTARTIVAEVFDANNLLLARGSSGPVDFNAKQQKASVTIFIRPVNSFLYANSVSAQSTCTTLAEGRAFHTATTLENGSVLIAGGYSLSGGQATYLSSTEIYNPETGSVTPGPTLQLARAHHTATHIPGTTKTIIAGGESAPAPNAAGGALQVGEEYDEVANTFTPRPMISERTRHVAGVPLPEPSGGQPALALLIGGNDHNGTPETSVEVYDPVNGFRMTPLNLRKGRSEAAGIPIVGGVLVAGGWDGSAGAKDITGVTSPDGLTFSVYSGGLTLQSAHVFPIWATLGSGAMVIMDGLSDQPTSDTSLSTASSVAEVIASTLMGTSPVSGAPSETRAFGGAAALLDGRVLVAGGGSSPGGSGFAASNTAQIVYTDENNNVAFLATQNSMSDARVGAAYTTLHDGTVLITGGFKPAQSSGSAATLNSIEVFQPDYQIANNTPYE